MKALTIWQPWASLIMVGAKPHEFRGRSYLEYSGHPAVGDRVVIHAGARPIRPAEVDDLLERLGGDDDKTGLVVDKARELLLRVKQAFKCRALPLGAGLGTATIGKPILSCDLYGLTVEDSDRGEFNWAWPLSAITPFDAPIEARGMQGFWQWSRT